MVAIACRLSERSDKVPVTRVDPAMAEIVRADMPVAEEAAMIAELMNNSVERLYDVGVVGIFEK